MKKIFALLLAVVMTMSLATVAFADNYAEGSDTPVTYPENTFTDIVKVTINKTYAQVGTNNSESPAETFDFSIVKGWTEGEDTVYVEQPGVGVTAENMPVPEILDVTYAAGEAGSETKVKDIVLNLPDYTNVGIYHYTITEADGNMAGVTYHANPIELVVTVIQQGDGQIRVAAVHTETTGDKSDEITNTYSAGDLIVTKTVDGNMGDRSKYFNFTVTFTVSEGDSFANNQIVTDAATTQRVYTAGENNSTTFVEYTFQLKHGEQATFTNIPANTVYTVAEASYVTDGYTTTFENVDTNNTIDASEIVTAAYTNTKTSEVDTGILMDSAPYVVMLLVAAAGLVLFTNKRRVQD